MPGRPCRTGERIRVEIAGAHRGGNGATDAHDENRGADDGLPGNVGGEIRTQREQARERCGGEKKQQPAVTPRLRKSAMVRVLRNHDCYPDWRNTGSHQYDERVTRVKPD